MSDTLTPVILSAVRTPIGRYLGGLSSFTAPQLGALVIREAVRRAGIDAGAVDEVIMGQVIQGGVRSGACATGPDPGRTSGTLPALTINKVCGSGLKAVMLAAQAIKAGMPSVVVAGGQEAMSARRITCTACATGIKAGNQTMVDGMIHDGLWDSFGCCHMGEYAEYTAEKAGVSGRTRMPLRTRATARPWPPRNPVSSRTRSCRCRSRARAGRPPSRMTKGPARTPARSCWPSSSPRSRRMGR